MGGSVMSDKIRVAIDAMGGDNAPAYIVKGAIEAAQENKNVDIILVGLEEAIKHEFEKYPDFDKSLIRVVNATENIDCNESPTAAIKKKKDSSIVVAMNLVKAGEADCVISAGSTGAVLVGGQLIIKRIRGIERTPLAPIIPTVSGVSMLVDSGANVDARPSMLVQYAQMASIYMEKVVGIKNPRVGIVNVGVEEEKGNALVKETYPLLKACKDINFIGSVEAREIPYGACDVIVCDAFVGNVILKLYEGTAGALVKMIKKGIMESTRGKLGGLLIKPSLKKTMKLFDTSEYGGAPFLGLNGLVVKIHGNSKDGEVRSAVRQCIAFKEQKIDELIRQNVVPEKQDI
jgi:glycerol-3-phosphate acyltransferase PlsX